MSGDPYLPAGCTDSMIDQWYGMADEPEEDIDPAQSRYRGKCRACKEIKNDISGDDGYCGDCN